MKSVLKFAAFTQILLKKRGMNLAVDRLTKSIYFSFLELADFWVYPALS